MIKPLAHQSANTRTKLPILLIDWQFYQKPVFAALNIAAYNLFPGAGGGPDIFGTEPWWYYLANGLLNFNLAFVLALLSLPMAVSPAGT